MTLSDAARSIADALVFLLAAALIVRVTAGGKALRGLLTGKDRATPERMQLLLVAVLLAGWYFFRVLAARGSVIPPLNSFCIWAFAISCTIYAVGKAVRTFER
jgi:hypothetical protein